MKNSSVAYKFLSVSLASIGALILLGLYGLHNVQSTFDWVGEVYETTQSINKTVDEIAQPLNELRQWSLLLLTVPEEKGRATLSQNIQNRITELAKKFEQWQSLYGNQSIYTQLYASWNSYKKLVEYTRQQVMLGYREAAFINVSGAEQQQFEQLSQQFATWRKLAVQDAADIYANANENYQYTLVAATIFIALFALGLSFFSGYVARPLVRSLRMTVDLADAIAVGNLDTPIQTRSGRDEVSQLINAFAKMQHQLRERLMEDKRIANEALRVNSALNNVTIAVVIADNNSNLIYSNYAANQLFTQEEKRIHQDSYFCYFDGRTMLGKTIDIFYKEPEKQRALEMNLTKSENFTLEMGALLLNVTITPVIDPQGERLGTVTEFKNITEQFDTEREINAVVHAASQGDFVQRIALEGKSGFFYTVSKGVNQVIAYNQQAVRDTMRMFAALSRGDLTQQIVDEYQGAFEQLKNDANNTVLRLTEVMGLIKRGALDINKAAGEIAQSTTSLSQRTESQVAILEKTASSMEEMTKTVQQNAENTNEAAKLALQARKHAENGGTVVNEAVHAMTAINKSSRKITDIISVINEIAFQTNLLALNAAVEAARAGEQGRGFAVVATEVRNLAQRSAAAAKEIKDLIRDSVQKVEDGTQLVNQSGETLEQIMLSVKKVSDIIMEISNAGQEQTSGIFQINKAIAQMDDMTQKNGLLVNALTSSSVSMNQQAKILSEQVEFFKLSHTTVQQVIDIVPPERVVKTATTVVAKKPVKESEWKDF